MSRCLGIYVDRNLIKYAKLKKTKGTLKVETFNVETFENLGEALRKVVIETNSYRVPISINISNELYNYFDTFSVLEKKDITNSLDIEFEKLCNEREYDKDFFESRYMLMDNKEDYEKYKALYVSVNKKEVEEKIEILSDNKLVSMTPVSTSITNLLNKDENENIAIINIENETQITTIIDGQINRVDILNAELGNLIEKINDIELSWKKSYNIFKNITIYDYDVKSLDEHENEYLDLVMPTIDSIAKESKDILEEFKEKITKVYITGMGATISNIDLYFQKYLKNAKCEILKPFFIDSTSLKLPIKDYIEVNSAIALALDGLGYVNQELNFAPVTKLDIDIENIINSTDDMESEMKKPFTTEEKMIARVIAVFIIAIIGYLIFSGIIVSQNNKKIAEAKEKISETENQIEMMDSDLSQIQSYTNTYSDLIASVSSNGVTENRTISKNAIPNLLNKIMFIIPKQVQLICIENTEEKHIVIEASSEEQEQLDYFLSAIKDNGILNNVISTGETETDSLIQITIEGDLP